MSNTTSTCSITSIGDLLDKGDKSLLNVTSTITACPHICSLAWGKGNPDLSGIGLNISYIMQAILAILCGPILALIYSFRDKLGLDERTQHRLSEIHNSFIHISAGFNTPVAIAAVIRIRQYAPFFEQYFLLFLVGMQLCSFIDVACAIPVFDRRHRRSGWIPLYLGMQGLLLFITFILMRGISKRASIKELIEGCGGYRRVLPFVVNFSKISEPILYQIVQWLMIAIFAVPLLFGFFFTIRTARRLFLRKKSKSQAERRQQSSQKMSRKWVILAVLLMLIMTLLVLYLTWFLQTMRSQLRAIAGDDFQDDRWGFGQIIAVFLWIPVCLQIVYSAIRFIWSRFRMNSGHRVRRMVNAFKDDQDDQDENENENEMDTISRRQPQAISQSTGRNRGEYIALE